MPIQTSSAGQAFGQPLTPKFGGTGPMTWGPDQEKIAQIQADASKVPYELKQQRFNTIWPWLQGQLGGMSKGGPATAGGASGQGPDITAGPVWNEQQMQQQVNAGKARTDQQTQTAQREASAGAAGRGFGGSSPLVQALQGQLAGQGMAAKSAGEQQTRWNAAQGNAQQTLGSQQARESQFASRQQEDIARRRPFFDLQTALIGTLGGLI